MAVQSVHKWSRDYKLGYLNFILNLVGYISYRGTQKYKETEELMSSFILLLLSTMYDSDSKIRDDKKLSTVGMNFI